MDYTIYYDLEKYLFSTVRSKFVKNGYLDAFDFFSIIIWKANRAKTKVADRLKKKGYENLDDAVRALTAELARQENDKDRLRCLVKSWGLLLPTASAILTVLYPDDFTIYDTRVCNSLGEFHELANVSNFDKLWDGYLDFKHKVIQATPSELSLRDKDRFLWGKSFFNDLTKNIKAGFRRADPPW